MGAVTEIVSFSMEEGLHPEDASSPIGKQFAGLLKDTASQSGCRLVTFGRELEKPQTLNLFIEWETAIHYRTYQKSR